MSRRARNSNKDKLQKLINDYRIITNRFDKSLLIMNGCSKLKK